MPNVLRSLKIGIPVMWALSVAALLFYTWLSGTDDHAANLDYFLEWLISLYAVVILTIAIFVEFVLLLMLDRRRNREEPKF